MGNGKTQEGKAKKTNSKIKTRRGKQKRKANIKNNVTPSSQEKRVCGGGGMKYS